MMIDGRIHVRDMMPSDRELPTVGAGRLLATLELDGQSLLCGNRSRIVLLAGELERCLDDLLAPLQALVLLVVTAAETMTRIVSWTATASGWLHVAAAFGARLWCVMHRERIVFPQIASVAFVAGEVLDFTLRSAVADVVAEVVLIVELSM